MKKFSKIAVTLGSVIMAQPIICLIGCSKTSEKKIITPTIKSISQEFDDGDTKSELIFYGFEYTNGVDIDSLEVTSSFKYESTQLPISICDINKDNRTFNVKLIFNSPVKTNLSGKISFSLNGEEILSSAEDYSFELSHKKYITLPLPSGRTADNRQISEGKATVQFKGFNAAGDVDLSSLVCQFSPDYPVSVICKVDVDHDKLFNITMEIAGCTQDKPISGSFKFYFGGKQLIINDDDQARNPFKVSFLDEKRVYPCETKSINGFYQDDVTPTVTFKKFSYQGYTQKELESISPEAKFLELSSLAEKTFKAAIENINTTDKTFDVKITYSKQDVGEYFGSITIGDIVLTGFSINLYYVVPESKLDIKKDSSSYRFFLNGFGESLTKEDEYNAILIPTKVGYIAANAFKDKITSDAYPNIKYLFFAENSELLYIGNNAFSGCTGLIGDIALPNSLKEVDTNHAIGESAFSGCSGLDGALTIPYNTEDFKIAKNAFVGCKFLQLDLSQYPNDVLPTWMINSDKMFDNWGWTAEVKGEVLLSNQAFESESYKNNLKAKLETFGFSLNFEFAELK